MTQAYDILIHEYNFPNICRQNNYITAQEASNVDKMAHQWLTQFNLKVQRHWLALHLL